MITPDQAVARYGSHARLAAILRVPSSTVRTWAQHGFLPDWAQMVLSLCVDPEHFKETGAQYQTIYGRYGGDNDVRFYFGIRRRGPRSVASV